MEKIKIKNPKDIIAAVKKWRNRRQENFLVITMDTGHVVTKLHHITKGLLDKTVTHPRECFYPAIKDYSQAVAFVHNHPSGNPQPSLEDDIVTERLCMTGVIIGINVIDHIIITPKGNYYSYRENGKIIEDYSTADQRRFIEEIVSEDDKYPVYQKHDGGDKA